eukprot:scaffold224914_cov27-Tisochrysis_lutea.AAC.5
MAHVSVRDKLLARLTRLVVVDGRPKQWQRLLWRPKCVEALNRPTLVRLAHLEQVLRLREEVAGLGKGTAELRRHERSTNRLARLSPHAAGELNIPDEYRPDHEVCPRGRDSLRPLGAVAQSQAAAGARGKAARDGINPGACEEMFAVLRDVRVDHFHPSIAFSQIARVAGLLCNVMRSLRGRPPIFCDFRAEVVLPRLQLIAVGG